MFIVDRIKEEIKDIDNRELTILVNNYLDCYNTNEENLKILKTIFEGLKNNKIVSCNILEKNKIFDGYKFVEEAKKENDKQDITIIKTKINSIKKDIDNIKDAYFIKNLLTLLENSKFFDSEDKLVLKFIFSEMNDGEKFEELKEEKNYKILIKD